MHHSLYLCLYLYLHFCHGCNSMEFIYTIELLSSPALLYDQLACLTYSPIPSDTDHWPSGLVWRLYNIKICRIYRLFPLSCHCLIFVWFLLLTIKYNYWWKAVFFLVSSYSVDKFCMISSLVRIDWLVRIIFIRYMNDYNIHNATNEY